MDTAVTQHDRPPNILVTGAGSLLGQGILRSLNWADRDFRIITADPDARSVGHWLGHSAYRAENADSPNFISRLEEIIRRESVDLILVGTDAELPIMSRERIRLENAFNLTVIVSPTEAVRIADDKWLTAEFLRETGHPFAASARMDEADEVAELVDRLGFPLFAKPRRGARSVGAQIVAGDDDLVQLQKKSSDYVLQEMLPDEPGEFTTGCLVINGRCDAIVTMRRDLRDGNTFRAFLHTSGEFDHELCSIAESVGADGPVNLQFRVRGGLPVVFEINARFSGTTPLRAIYGFNEVEAMVNYCLDGTPIKVADLTPGVIMRAWSDILIPADELAQLDQSGELHHPSCESFHIGSRAVHDFTG